MAVKQAKLTTDDTSGYSAQQLGTLLHALQAAKSGDFSVRLPVTKNGVLSQICKEFNEVIALNESMAEEVKRVGRIVGGEGRMTERAALPDSQGSWAVTVNAINRLIEDLARPTTEVARVITAVAEGDLSQKMALEIEGTPVKGEFLRIGTTVNTMVDQLSSFADEVTRVAREVGTEGKLGGQAEVKGVSGTWKDLTDNVNSLAGNLTNQVRNIALVTTAVANGDLSQQITVEAKGEILELKDTINKMVDQLNTFAGEVTRVAREVGTEGKLGGQAEVQGVSGTWKDLTDNVNFMATNLTTQVRGIAKVVTAVANGDLNEKFVVEAKGEIAALADTINSMTETLGIFAEQVTTVAREVGTEGKLGGQARVPNVAGTWKALTDNVNFMASNLTTQVRDIAKVVTAVADGDLSQKVSLEKAKGEVAALADTINGMTETLGTFAGEVTRVAREVGTQGKLGGQAVVPNVAGTWKDLTDNVNSMASNLTNQVRNIALVTTAVAKGDLSQKITVDVQGEILELKETINTMVDQLNTFAGEVTRVAREVGTEGKLGGQAEVEGVSGTWKDLTDSVNSLAGNLTNQVRNIALVSTAVANGDLSQQITVEAKGEILELKDTINKMVGQLNTFAGEVTRVAREVGTEGKLGGQAEVQGVSGTWKDLTDSVNSLAGNLTNQVRNIALVTTAIASGDLSKKITVDVKGEILELKNTINTMVDRLLSFADEVTRVAREVGTEGKLGGQAEVQGVSGTWKDLTDNVNSMATNLTTQVRNIALVTTAVAHGDLSKQITVDVQGEILELKNTINTMVDQLRSFAAEVTRVAREVGTEGKLGGQAMVPGVSGTWKDLTDNVNFMASNLTTQVRNIAKVVTAVADGDLNQKVSLEAKGEVAALADTINSMTETLGIFAEQVTTVAREVGTEGKLGGQARVPNVSGTWKDLTDNVNFMATNLTTQVRGIAKVVTAVANGDLNQKFVVEAKGEIAALADTINSMTETLGTFAGEVTRVAREVGTEGKLGGQAEVPNVAGTWKDLTDNVNFMADSLTTQVRAISEVSTAVTEGDLTRSIMVEAEGEVADLKNKINQMIANLKDTTEQNKQQDWLKTNLARFSRLMQGQKDLDSVSRLIMSELTPLVSAHHGVFFINEASDSEPMLGLLNSYGYKERKHVSSRFHFGESLVGQCALEKKSIVLTNVPRDYIQINSGLGEATPLNIIVLPVLFEGDVMAVIELASFLPFSEIHRTFLDQLMESIGVVLNMITANMRTEELLEQSQSLTQNLQSQQMELQSQQEQLKESNTDLEEKAKELEEKATLLAEQNNKVELKNREVELARAALEEKAEQLALSSKYKSEFLANMSHELRTPLNSMLILAKLLEENSDGNLSAKQIKFANTIYASGGDLLSLINEILDLSKVEAGKMQIDIAHVPIASVQEYVERTFTHVAQEKGLGFSVKVAPDVPENIATDSQRLQQILRNLLSNAFKFTDQGRVDLTIGVAPIGEGFSQGEPIPDEPMVAFEVRDTGIGIPKDKQMLIFEAFQQADGTTSRKYGGTGLGLSISKEITRLLGGGVRVDSEPGKGSAFTLYLPQNFRGPIPSGPRPGPASGDYGQSDDYGQGEFSGNGHSARPEAVEAPAVSALSDQGMPEVAPLKLGDPILHYSPPSSHVQDDRGSIEPNDRVILIVEDDVHFARILLDMARNQGFKGLVAQQGDIALNLAEQYKPDSITLDLKLPRLDGWTVLDRLKKNPQTRHIPVQVISVMDRDQGVALGAISYLEKPVSGETLEGAFAHIKNFIERNVRDLLLVESDDTERETLVELLTGKDVAVTAVGTADSARAALDSRCFDCVVLDIATPTGDGIGLLKEIKKNQQYQDIPVIIYTGMDLTHEEESQLKKYATSTIAKDAKSADRLLDETALFLHRIVAKMPAAKRKIIEQRAGLTAIGRKRPGKNNGSAVAQDSGAADDEYTTESNTPHTAQRDKEILQELAGRQVLVVDDDYRNIYALASMLETYGIIVTFAENGNAAIEALSNTPDIDVVLMDVMMPGMDGYVAMETIRKMERFRELPIIALTAKAMSGDREKCLAAGASDYIPKPADVDRLLNMIRQWVRPRIPV